MKKDRFYLSCIEERLKKIETYLEGKTKKDFLDWELLRSALAYNLQTIKRLSKKVDLEIADIPWHAIGDLDNKSEFGYIQIDLEIFWKLAKQDLPKLKKRVTKMIEFLEEKNS